MPETNGDVMLNFLFRGRNKAEPEVKIETQRETFIRLTQELNDAIAKLADKPAVTVEPATGQVSFALPEQFPDEALALPKPETEPETPAADPDPETSPDQTDEDASPEAPDKTTP
ncbi:MAG: hypothetical protein AAGC82_16865 [Pseudomonadota bacterium]